VDGPEAVPHLEDVSENNDQDSDYTADDQADDAAQLHFCVFLPAHVCAIVIEIARLVLEILVALGAALCSLRAIVDARD